MRTSILRLERLARPAVHRPTFKFPVEVPLEKISSHLHAFLNTDSASMRRGVQQGRQCAYFSEQAKQLPGLRKVESRVASLLSPTDPVLSHCRREQCRCRARQAVQGSTHPVLIACARPIPERRAQVCGLHGACKAAHTLSFDDEVCPTTQLQRFSSKQQRPIQCLPNDIDKL